MQIAQDFARWYCYFYKKYYEDATDCATRIGSKIRNHYFLLLTFKLFPRTLLSEAAFFAGMK